VILDFDGTLSEIVARPELARPVPGAREILAALTERVRVVAIVTGRRSEEIAPLVDVEHLRYVGLYGLEDLAPQELAIATVPLVEREAAAVEGAWVEDKGPSIAVHYRAARDPAIARRALVLGLTRVAAENGLELIEGKMVVELVPPGRPRKGGAVERLAGELELTAVLYAGDDVADLDAFAALDRLRDDAVTCKVAVRGAEAPASLLEQADLVVEGPSGLVALLEQLR